MARVWFATAAAFGALAVVNATVAGSAVGSPVAKACDTGRAYLRDGELEKALDTYLASLADEDAPCIDAGLAAVAAAKRRESRHCMGGDALAQSGREDEALRQYRRALDVNVTSECARKGLALPPSSKSRVERFFDYLPTFPIQLGSLVLMLAVGIGLIALIRSVVLRRASLVVRPFADGAVETKVGRAFGGLVEERLVGFWQKREQTRDDGYSLDLVAANVELLAEDEALGDAVADLAQVPQLQLVAAVVSFIDRAFLQRRLSAVGELLPEGARGCGVSVSLFKRRKLKARANLWEEPTATDGRTALAAKLSRGPVLLGPVVTASAGPSPVARYYGLAAAAAAWVQFEASRALDDRVGLVTTTAESFSLLSAGIDAHRDAATTADDASYDEAGRMYQEALEVDPENVAALVNLALLGARRQSVDDESTERFEKSLNLLERARAVLEHRYMESLGTSKGIPKHPELADPTWYRIRYARAAQHLHAGRFDDAERHALALVKSTAAVLTEIGWRYANRQPTWFTSWYKRAPAHVWRGVRRAAGRARRRSVLGDWELARFLARTVEPAAVVLWWSTQVEQDKRKRERLVDGFSRRPARTGSVDRRREKDPAWLQSYLNELLPEPPPPERSAIKRLFAELGVAQWRAPEKPNGRVDYNLACLFSRLASGVEGRESRLQQSADHLERCLAGDWGARRGESARWAHYDPGLRGLREFARTQFEGIVGPDADVKEPEVISDPMRIRLRNGLAIGLCVLGLAALVAIPVVLLVGIPFG